MTERNEGSNRRAAAVLGLGMLVAGLAGLTGGAADPPAPAKQPSVGGIPLFADWPKGAKPDAVIVLTGQTFGYLQPCGCTRPQYGGLERRANFINGLRAKGWPVAAADLGDLYPQRDDKGRVGPSGILAPPEQAMEKYKTAMNALREMGYVAVGVGKTELEGGLFPILANYALQKEQRPFTLAGNIQGKGNPPIPREKLFPPEPPATRPLVGAAEVARVGDVPVSFTGVVGKDVAEAGKKADPALDFEKLEVFLPRVVPALANHPGKPQLNVLLYQGDAKDAKALAQDWPQFQVILCLSEDSEPPSFPESVAGPKHPAGQKTQVIQVGHKGRFVGALGVFRKPDGSLDLKYQLVPLGEEYLTPKDPAAEKANLALPLLEAYAAEVKKARFLEKIPQQPHRAQVLQANLNISYVGSERCQGCHPAEYAKWKDTPHSHALEALEKVASRPGLRNHDAECLVCHTIGMGYKTGFQSAEKTASLTHVGCESCHGPGSGHMGNPKNPELLKLLSPWKENPPDKLPDQKTLEAHAKLPKPGEQPPPPLTPAQQRVLIGVRGMCMKCHDGDNDPYFDVTLSTNWKKIAHTGLANR